MANKHKPNSQGDIITIGNVGAGATIAAGSGASATQAHSGQTSHRPFQPSLPSVPSRPSRNTASDRAASQADESRHQAQESRHQAEEGRIGQYQLVDVLGKGGMAEVYKAYQPQLQRYVAIKFILPQFATHEGFRSRFEREAVAIARLSHGNIVHVYDFGEQDGRYYLVMEFIEGRTLSEYWRALKESDEELNLAQILWLMQQMGSALDFAHQRGIIHRDIKPDNVMLNVEGRVVLTDFGIAKILEGAEELTRTGAVMGTPAYMSPEQVEGDKDKIGPASDIYSLGIMLYELVTGQRPFSGNSAQSIMYKQVYDAVPPPRTLHPRLPEALEQVILKMLAKNPADRYEQAADFLKDLEQAIAQEPIAVRPPPMSQEKKKSLKTLSFPTSRASEHLPTEPMTSAEQERPKSSSWQHTTVVESSPTERGPSHLGSTATPFWQQIPSWVWLAVVVLLLLVIGSMLVQ